ncbi:MAG: TlpA family protein disulfide reductase [Brumimicrobium sp.]|nr:TlpA family protein disulfide reductase [Brumimicrobium sp.]
MDYKKWIWKRKWDIFFALLLGLLLIPSVRIPVVAFVQRMIAFSPSEIAEDKRESLNSYNWILVDLKGKQTNLSISEGKVIIINSWATWCPPCVAEMPSFQKLYNSYKDKVDFYFVASDDPSKVSQFMIKNEYDLPIYFQVNNPPKELESDLLPTSFVVDKQGKIIIKEVGTKNWDSQDIHDLLDKELAK